MIAWGRLILERTELAAPLALADQRWFDRLPSVFPHGFSN